MTDGTTSGSSVLSHADAEALRGTAKWARFLAIVGFVMLGLILLFWIFFGSMIGAASSAASEMQMEQMRALQEMQGMEGMEGLDLEAMQESQQQALSGASMMAGAMGFVIIILVVALAFFPTLLLYQFGTRTLKALNGPMDGTTFTSALNSHRRYYKFSGILMIIVLCIYALVFLFAGLGAAMM